MSSPSPFRNDPFSFFRAFWREKNQIGSILPSSRKLAQAMSASIAKSTATRRILEVGVGTGAVTSEIIKVLGAKDSLTLLEPYQPFFQRLERVLPTWLASKKSPNIVLQATRIQEFQSDQQFDAIVCSLPFSNFTPQDVQEIFAKFWNLVTPEGYVIYYEYWGLRRPRSLLKAPGRRRVEQQGMDQYFRKFIYPNVVTRKLVFANIPPALVLVVKSPR
jgi:phosphatidylethanolamine/phosphatidyl-N-methylethanolamine N-methyltransferase